MNTAIKELRAKIEADGMQQSGPSTVDVRMLCNEYENLFACIAKNFEDRAKNIASHSRCSHTANGEQKRNMVVMFNTWTAAAEYVREQVKK